MISRTRIAARRSAFTLIELLVVIGIVVILIGLGLPALQRARYRAQQVQATNDMSQIANAIGTYKAKMNVSYLPAFGSCPTAGKIGYFQLRGKYWDPADSAGRPAVYVSTNSPEAMYLKQLFPFLPPTNPGVYNTFTTGLPDVDMDPNQTLLFFLTGGNVNGINFQGFSTNKTNPFSTPSAGEQRIGPFLEVKLDKIRIDGTNGMAWYVDPWSSPYAYFAWEPQYNNYASYNWPTTTSSWASTTNHGPYSDTTGKAQNPKTFQLISAGKNARFGTGGVLNPGQGQFSLTGDAGDNLSNFTKGLFVYQGTD
jgi:prepilin-type N-terminal cleavage/methylation domain-containing protein